MSLTSCKQTFRLYIPRRGGVCRRLAIKLNRLSAFWKHLVVAMSPTGACYWTISPRGS